MCPETGVNPEIAWGSTMVHSLDSRQPDSSQNSSGADVDRLRDFLKKDPDIELGILFGSMARGKVLAESDVDLALQKADPMSAEEKMALIEQIALITGRSVDLVDLRTVGEPLLGQILKYGQRLTGSDTRFAELGLKHVYAQADFMPLVERVLRERRQQWLEK